MSDEREELMRLRDLNKSEIIEVQHLKEQTPDLQNKNKGDDCCKKPVSEKKHHKNPCIFIYTIFTCLSCLYLETTQFYPLIQDNVKKAILTKLSYFVVFMCIWSYIQTARIKNDVNKMLGVPHINDNKLLDGNFLSKQCEHCKYYKLPRVSHCSTCRTCIYKLDHHCMWTQNCIGFRNQKCFYLFTFYMSIGLVQFWYGSIMAFTQIYNKCYFFSHFEPGVYILWLITTFSATFVGIMIIALLFSHTMMIMTNFTTLTGMKTKKVCPIPVCECRDQILQEDNINQFDRGEIQNIRELFGTNILTCFLPFAREIEHDFLFEKQNPIPTEIQVSKFTGQYYEDRQREREIERLLSTIRLMYKGRKAIINEQLIEL